MNTLTHAHTDVNDTPKLKLVNFTQTPNSIIRNPDLSPEVSRAIEVMHSLSSAPGFWGFRVSYIIKQAALSERKWRRVSKQLKGMGVITYQQTSDGMRLVYLGIDKYLTYEISASGDTIMAPKGATCTERTGGTLYNTKLKTQSYKQLTYPQDSPQTCPQPTTEHMIDSSNSQQQKTINKNLEPAPSTEAQLTNAHAKTLLALLFALGYTDTEGARRAVKEIPATQVSEIIEKARNRNVRCFGAYVQASFKNALKDIKLKATSEANSNPGYDNKLSEEILKQLEENELAAKRDRENSTYAKEYIAKLRKMLSISA